MNETALAGKEEQPFWQRHIVALILGGFVAILVVIVLGQLFDQVTSPTGSRVSDPFWTYVSCFLMVWLDAWIPIFPGETTLSAASTLAATDGSGIALEYVMLAGALGAVLGDSTLFWIARTSSKRVQPWLDKSLRTTRSRPAGVRSSSRRGLSSSPGATSRTALRRERDVRPLDMPYRRFLPGRFSAARSGRSTRAHLPTRSTTLAGYPLASLVISGCVTSAAIALIF